MSRKGELLFVCCAALSVFSAHAEMTYFAHQGKLRTVVMIGEGKPVGTGTVSKIDEMADKKYGDSWNLQFSGVVNVTAAGKYEFAVTSDDGSALFIDGNAVVMNDGLHGPANKKGTSDLAIGKHQVNLLYFNNNGGHALKATVKSPSGQEADLASACTPSSQKYEFSKQQIEAERQKEAVIAQKAEAEAQKATQMELLKLSSPEALARSIKFTS